MWIESETIDNISFRCPKVKLIWQICPINQPNVETIMNFARRWNDIFNQYPNCIDLGE